MQADCVAALRDFAAVLAANWEPPDAQILRFYEITAKECLDPSSGQIFFVGYLNQIPVACCELQLGPHHQAGVYAATTLKPYRRRGFASEMLLHAIHAAQEKGMELLQVDAEQGHVNFYLQLGFRPFDTRQHTDGTYRLLRKVPKSVLG